MKSESRFMRLPQVCEACGLKRSQIYALESQGKFPSKIKLSPRVTVWREDEISAWIDEQTAAARGEGGK